MAICCWCELWHQQQSLHQRQSINFFQPQPHFSPQWETPVCPNHNPTPTEIPPPITCFSLSPVSSQWWRCWSGASPPPPSSSSSLPPSHPPFYPSLHWPLLLWSWTPSLELDPMVGVSMSEWVSVQVAGQSSYLAGTARPSTRVHLHLQSPNLPTARPLEASRNIGHTRKFEMYFSTF